MGRLHQRAHWIDGVRRALSILPTQALHDDGREVVDINHRLARLDELVDRLCEGRSRPSPLRARGGRRARRRGAHRIGAFGGFLDRSIRRKDFALGWARTEAWTGPGLAGHRVDEPTIEGVLAELDRARVLSGPDAGGHADGIEQLGRVGRWQLFLLAVLRVGAGQRGVAVALGPGPRMIGRGRS